jgi:hypothetical protein
MYLPEGMGEGIDCVGHQRSDLSCIFTSTAAACTGVFLPISPTVPLTPAVVSPCGPPWTVYLTVSLTTGDVEGEGGGR